MSNDDHGLEPNFEPSSEADTPIDQASPKLPRSDTPELRPVNFHKTNTHPNKELEQAGVKPISDGALVFGFDEVMKVFRNQDARYSVKGYCERSEKAFGAFFLGMDPSEDYWKQSTAINNAVTAITREEGFAYGSEATARILKDLDGDPPDPQKLTDGMLAEVCRALFGIPDEKHIVSGGFEVHLLSPGRCPGDYAPMSGCIFLPEPSLPLRLAGEHLGHILKKQTLAFVQDYRDTGTVPDARLTKVLFEAFQGETSDLLARTLVGIMMGLLPTTEGNLVQVLKSLQHSGDYYALRAQIQALGGSPNLGQADVILCEPMFRAMQVSPMPPAVWRTATEDHEIASVPVKAGQKVEISIKSATQEALKAGRVDVSPVFGGIRSDNSHPTHACPGFELAVGMMLGTLATAMALGR